MQPEHSWFKTTELQEKSNRLEDDVSRHGRLVFNRARRDGRLCRSNTLTGTGLQTSWPSRRSVDSYGNMSRLKKRAGDTVGRVYEADSRIQHNLGSAWTCYLKVVRSPWWYQLRRVEARCQMVRNRSCVISGWRTTHGSFRLCWNRAPANLRQRWM